MSKRSAIRQIVLRSLAAAFGTGLLAYLVWRIGPSKLLQDVSRVGWGLALIIALGGLAHVVKAWAWRFTLSGEEHKVSFPRLLQLRLVSEAVGQLGVFGQAFGEGIRASALSAEIPAAWRISSVTLDRGLFIATGALVMLAGVVTAPFALALGHGLRRYLVIFALALICLLLLMAVAVQKRWPILSSPARAARKLRHFSAWLERRESVIKSAETRLFEFHHDTPRAFWASVGLNLVWHGMAVMEVYLTLWLLGAKVGFLGALVFEALTKLVNIIGLLSPGNIGTYEGGNVVIARMLKLGGDTGLALGLARRLRAVFWGAVGSVCLMMLSRGPKSRNFERETESLDELARTPAAPPEAEPLRHTAGQSPVGLVLANSLPAEDGIEASLTKVGAVPVILRAILGLKKAGVTRIVVCVDSAYAPELKQNLSRTRRLPERVNWFETAPGSHPLPELIGRLTVETPSQLLLVVDGTTIYHPALLRDIVAWNRESDALMLTSGNRLVGICALSPESARLVADQTRVSVDTFEQLNAFLASGHSVDLKPVQEDCWQRVLTPADRISAERKLDRWLVKPTDGIFARMNRKVSIPISRQLIKWPVTPNMVSLFTLGVGFASGLFFACGSYWSVLFGAMLSVWASILDGCDGEVARLKLQESDFGCWLETICDYFYYLFVFSGMAIGLVRSFGPAYLVWTGLLLFGAITSFLVTGAGRRRFASERPEQYLGIWQRHAESRRSNPILYVGRHLEFIVRRCFFPYALLFFAALNITRVAFVLSAIGVNVVWFISLYSYRTFVVARTPSPTSSEATL